MATTKSKKDENIIEDITYESSKQSISRRVIYEFKNTKIKLSLKSDSYKCQSYARAEALDGYDWKPIYSIPNTLMWTPTELRYFREFQPSDADFSKASHYFDNDVKRLKKGIENIL